LRPRHALDGEAVSIGAAVIGQDGAGTKAAWVVTHYGDVFRLRHLIDAEVEWPRDAHLVQLLVAHAPNLSGRRPHAEGAGRYERQLKADGVGQHQYARPDAGGERGLDAFLDGEAIAAGAEVRQRVVQPEQFGARRLAGLVEQVGQGEPGDVVGWVSVQSGQ